MKPCEAMCERGDCVQPKSCQGDAAVSCAGGASCCNAIFIPEDGLQDTINMRYARAAQDGSDESDVRYVERTLRPITLDRFEVTVSRFRQFLSSYDLELPPQPNQGAHPAFPDSGWQSAWSEPGGPLPATAKNLQGDLLAQGQTVTQDVPGDLPVRGVDWYAAFAFCIWDGGRLPSEAEWAYAAFGGKDDRLYPWSVDRTTPTHKQACFSDDDEMSDAPLPVGSLPDGQGRFGHDDLAGNLYEWVADSFQDELMSDCTRADSAGVDAHECLALDDRARRVIRGGSYADSSSLLRNTARVWHFADAGMSKLGFRCARDVAQNPTRR
jgi:formylglycine-generating enzyme required for sulfatase activity